MKKRTLLSFVLSLALVAGAVAAPLLQNAVAGHWEGAITLRSGAL